MNPFQADTIGYFYFNELSRLLDDKVTVEIVKKSCFQIFGADVSQVHEKMPIIMNPIPYTNKEQVLAICSILNWYDELSETKVYAQLRHLFSKIIFSGKGVQYMAFIKSIYTIFKEIKACTEKDAILKMVLISAAQKVIHGILKYLLPLIKRWIGTEYKSYEMKLIQMLLSIPSEITEGYRGQMYLVLANIYKREKRLENEKETYDTALDDLYVTGGYRYQITDLYRKCLIGTDMTPPRIIKIKPIREMEIKSNLTCKNVNGKRIYSETGTIGSTVETIVLDHFSEQGYTGVHSERRMPLLVLNLLLQDQIQDGAYILHSFQEYPYDYHLKSFSDRIKKDFSSTDDLLNRVYQNWESCTCKFKDDFTMEEVQGFITVLGYEKIWIILTRFMEGIRVYSYGFPDLCIWNSEKVLFVEVKSETDRISPHQVYWIHYLNTNSIESILCNVI
jgi:hypothetical protein